MVKRKKEAYKRWQKTRSQEDLAAYKSCKRIAKATVAKAKNTEMDALYEKMEGRNAEKFVFGLAKTRHRATQTIRMVKFVKSTDGVPEEAS